MMKSAHILWLIFLVSLTSGFAQGSKSLLMQIVFLALGVMTWHWVNF